MAASRRDDLIDTAVTLFHRDGYHATGIDKILAACGAAKMTLYKHFKSKDELIVAALRRRDEQWRNRFMRAVERHAGTPRERLLAVFDALEECSKGGDLNGCMFVNAAAEFARADDPIHATAAEHKRLVLGYVRDLAEAAGARDPMELAQALRLLIEGAIVVAQVSGDTDAAQRARRVAETLLVAAID